MESKDTRQGSGGQGQEKGNGKWTRDKAQKTLSGHTGRGKGIWEKDKENNGLGLY